MVTVSARVMCINAKKKQRLPMNPTNPRAAWRCIFEVLTIPRPIRHTSGVMTIRPARKRTNSTSKAGNVLPRCLTSDAITISRKAPTTTKQAPRMFGEMRLQRSRMGAMKVSPGGLVSGDLDISRQCARHPDTCQTSDLTLRMVPSRPTVNLQKLLLTRGTRR